MGPQKCVLVLGVKPQDLRDNFQPTFEQVEPLALKPLSSSPGQVIKTILDEACEKAGEAPLSIISDAGSDLKKGIRLFSEENGKVTHSLDISHRLNSCLKEELNKREDWKSFQKASGMSVQYLKLSSIAHLCPPRQRTKERMHSAFQLIQWGRRLLDYFDREGKKLCLELRNKISWICEYEHLLAIYNSLMKISQKALQIVHERGYYRSLADDFMRISEEDLISLECIEFRKKVRDILREEGEKIPDGQHYLGSSEIIESIFGSFKAMEGDHASSGLTSLVLGIPALSGKIDEDIIESAMEGVSTVDLKNWIQENMGSTFLSMRRRDLHKTGKIQ